MYTNFQQDIIHSKNNTEKLLHLITIDIGSFFIWILNPYKAYILNKGYYKDYIVMNGILYAIKK